MKNINHEKIMNILLIIVSLLLVFNLYLSLNHISQYDSRKQEGNDRWLQVDTILQEYDNRIKDIEKELNKGE